MQNLETTQCERLALSPEESDGRARIVRAAYPLFVESGYASVSMQDIADAVPIHKATLYHHFQNKDDLFIAVVRVWMRQLHKQIESIMQEERTASIQLKRIAVQLFHDNQSELGRLMSDVNQHITIEQRQDLITKCTDPWSLYEEIFRRATARGEVPVIDPSLAAAMFVGLIYGQTRSLHMGRIKPPLDEARAAFLVDTLLDGLRASCPAQLQNELAPSANRQANLI